MKEQLFLTSLLIKPNPSFDNFVLGENQEVVFILQNLSAGQAVYLWGGVGSGKSHLLHSLMTEHTHLFTSTSFPHQQHDIPPIMAGDYVLIDDVQDFSDEQKEVLFNLYNEWQARKAKDNAFTIVSTGNLPPLQMQMREDLRNRLGWGMVYALHTLNDEDSKNALKKRADEKGFTLSDDVLQWIFTYCPRDMRTLFALLEALDEYSLSQKRPITIPLIKNFIKSQEIFQ
ncbi:HdaA/DnaA family protein [Pelistega ratti]|uniref:HdaA/DnaA family protein n=1 Tax=Pelistega ratti TaxID=2652177 RepID=UPI001358269B|nr:DnaA/Hda family protein [Pelistega ratti]